MPENSLESPVLAREPEEKEAGANLSRWFPRVDGRNPIIRLMSGIWRHIVWLAIDGGVAGLIVNALLSAWARGTNPVAALVDVQRWIVWEKVAQYPVITSGIVVGLGVFILACKRADVAVRWEEAIAPYRDSYVIERVSQVKPETYLTPYLPSVRYVERPADDDVVSQLRRLRQHRPGASDGVCVIGIPMAGKTRMAWRAMKNTLGDYLFIRWPHRATDLLPIEPFKHDRVVVWLDNLHDYANEFDAPRVAEIRSNFMQQGVGVIIVATCWSEDIWEPSDTSIATLLNTLTRIRPQDIVKDKARSLYADVSKARPDTAPAGEFEAHWDKRTPGSLIVGPLTMKLRFIAYPEAERVAKNVLWTMQILQQAGFGTVQPESRVRAACSDLFAWPRDDTEAWQRSLGGLRRQGFLDEQSSRDGEIRPGADVYLNPEMCILPSDEWGKNWAKAWRNLPDVFLRTRDSEALAKLGFALLDSYARSDAGADAGSAESLRAAETCFRFLLDETELELTDGLSAMVQANLGVVLLLRAQLAKRAGDLEGARDLATHSKQACTTAWALFASLRDNPTSPNWQRWNDETAQAKTNRDNAEALLNELKRSLEQESE